MRGACLATVMMVGLGAFDPARAQDVQAQRQAVVAAEDRRAATSEDLKVLKDGTRSPDESVQRMAVRALGRLERPALVADIVPLLAARSAAVRAEAVNALGQVARNVERVRLFCVGRYVMMCQ
jgi:HEAT repeat protein